MKFQRTDDVHISPAAMMLFGGDLDVLRSRADALADQYLGLYWTKNDVFHYISQGNVPVTYTESHLYMMQPVELTDTLFNANHG